MLEVNLAALNQMLMQMLGVLSSPLQPRRNGAFIQSEGAHNRLHGVAMRQQGQDDCEQIDGLMQR